MHTLKKHRRQGNLPRPQEARATPSLSLHPTYHHHREARATTTTKCGNCTSFPLILSTTEGGKRNNHRNKEGKGNHRQRRASATTDNLRAQTLSRCVVHSRCRGVCSPLTCLTIKNRFISLHIFRYSEYLTILRKLRRLLLIAIYSKGNHHRYQRKAQPPYKAKATTAKQKQGQPAKGRRGDHNLPPEDKQKQPSPKKRITTTSMCKGSKGNHRQHKTQSFV